MDEAEGVWMGEDTRGVQALARKAATPTQEGGGLCGRWKCENGELWKCESVEI